MFLSKCQKFFCLLSLNNVSAPSSLLLVLSLLTCWCATFFWGSLFFFIFFSLFFSLHNLSKFLFKFTYLNSGISNLPLSHSNEFFISVIIYFNLEASTCFFFTISISLLIFLTLCDIFIPFFTLIMVTFSSVKTFIMATLKIFYW